MKPYKEKIFEILYWVVVFPILIVVMAIPLMIILWLLQIPYLRKHFYDREGTNGEGKFVGFRFEPYYEPGDRNNP